MHPPERARARRGLVGLALLASLTAVAATPPARASRRAEPSSAAPATGLMVGEAAVGGLLFPPRLTRAEAVRIVLAAARAQIGKPYKWGATGPKSFDCSGLTRFAWAAAGVQIPRVSRIQYRDLPHVSLKSLQPGDLVFFGTRRIHHVGIYIGNGRMINAPHSGARVQVQKLWRDVAGAARPPLG